MLRLRYKLVREGRIDGYSFLDNNNKIINIRRTSIRKHLNRIRGGFITRDGYLRVRGISMTRVPNKHITKEKNNKVIASPPKAVIIPKGHTVPMMASKGNPNDKRYKMGTDIQDMYQVLKTPETFTIYPRNNDIKDPGPEHVHDFQVYHRNTLIAHVWMGGENGIRKAVITNYINHPVYKAFKIPNMVYEDLTSWISRRVVPRTRGDIEDILSEMGMMYYSPLAIMKYTHGVMFEDFMWVKFKGENHTFDEVKMRG